MGANWPDTFFALFNRATPSLYTCAQTAICNPAIGKGLPNGLCPNNFSEMIRRINEKTLNRCKTRKKA